ncbi:DUF423 domain-containing protein [Pseudomonas sp. TTU2014-080ASC]|jgi:uncharacterized membrane protein YgdD (TMEM256/DUF423 family)|uniref:DUF423 domain-containing protein n=1 Tax=Pseudomonas sp. TTU2014-080ASC TaxID=1729724 RepID=UPI0007185117|nr:DUF423 domain-containing protein [Pseudomonas sp. TTU2014-080ASC]KRW61538.1 hypothetical protein AO726_09470 [Pseudomonas sp. TTU2014-080ASC]
MARLWLLLAAVAGCSGVGLGAYGAHGLKRVLTPEYLAIFQTATQYQLIHALALFGVSLLATQRGGRLVSAAGGLFTVGIVLFCGSLYVLTLTGTRSMGMVAPIGGLSFMLGWLMLGLAALKKS